MKTSATKFWPRVSAFLLIWLAAGVANASAALLGQISDTNKYAWSEASGWHNFMPAYGGVTINSDHLSGYAWAANAGWVKLGADGGGPYANTTATNWGVNRDPASGALSGYAWSEAVGWIAFQTAFSQVTINPGTREFDGYAYNGNIGYIHFNNASPAYTVQGITGMVYNPTTDFSITNGNPNGLWTYGWMPTDFSSFEALPFSGTDTHSWLYWTTAENNPSVRLNGSTVTFAQVTPGQLSLHPGPSGQAAVLRFTAPMDGLYHINGQFYAGDYGVMQVGVRQAASWLWQGTNAGNFSLNDHLLLAGETMDFVVYGGYTNGNTPLALTITIPVVKPDAPTMVTATAGDGQAIVTFAAPLADGGSAITGYTVTSNPPGGVDTGAGTMALAHVITGLANNTPYTFTVTAANVVGASENSAPSSSVTPIAPLVAQLAALPNPAGCQQTITVDAGASSPAASITEYAISFGDGSADAIGTEASATHAYAAFGTYTATVTITDDLARTASTSTTITVNQGNTPPVAHPGGQYTVTLGSGTAFDGSASSEPDGACGDTLVSYAWDIGAGALSLTGATPALTPAAISMLGLGTFPVTLTVTDSLGSQAMVATTLRIVPVTYTLAVEKTGTGSGAVLPDMGTITWSGNSGQTEYDNGSIVTLTAVADTGSTFTGWTGACTGTGTCQVTMDAVMSAGATFTLNTYALSVGKSGTGIGTVDSTPAGITCGADCAESYGYGSTVAFTPNADPGSIFKGWSGACSGTGSCEVVVDADVTITARFELLTPPAAPAMDKATVSGNGEAQISFSPPTADGGSVITGYTVTSDPDGIVVSSDSSPITVTGLTGGTAYTFTVTASNALGASVPSALSNSVTPVTPAGAPVMAGATAGNGKATITFTPPALDGGSPITGYTVTSDPGNISVSGAQSPLIIIGLTNDTAYTFTVTASNAVGISAASSPSNSVTPTTKTLAEAVNNPAWSMATGGNANWYAQTAVTHDGSIAARSGILGDNQQSWMETATTCPSTLNFWWKVSSEVDYDYLRFTLDGVEQPGVPGISGEVEWTEVSGIVIPPGSHQLRWLYAKDQTVSDGSDAGWVDQVLLTRTPVAAGAPVMDAALAGTGAATVSFSPPVADACSGPIVGYTVTSSPDGITASSDHSPVTVTGLSNGTTYTFTVTAINDAGASAASAASNPVIPVTVPDAPVIGSATAGDGKATVSFEPPAFDGGSSITGYTVTATPGGFTASGTGSPLTVVGLTNGKGYRFTVTATNVVGSGQASVASTIVIPMRDGDGDGAVDVNDNCPDTANADQADTDGDGVGDLCDILPANALEWHDTDGDGVGDNLDNCVAVVNASQADADNDARGDACDSQTSTANYGSVIDAPHNETRGVGCGDCHSYTLWWQHSPATASTAPNYGAITNAVCAKCHAMTTHASATPGAWAMNCSDCHSAHHQAQLAWRGSVTIDELYLKNGIINGNFVVNGGQTTFAYTLTEFIIPSHPEWNDPATWGKKDSSLPPSGLILVVDIANADNTYEVISATATTITVKGGVDPGVAGKSFGLIYGGLINKEITTPSQGVREVRFFNPQDPAGGYTDSNTPVSGICQVCHANTVSWTSVGGGSDPAHASGLNCTGCHTMAQGFRP